MGFNRRKIDAQRAAAAEKEAAAKRATEAQILEDAGRLVAAWNERQAKRMPMLFSPTIGCALSSALVSFREFPNDPTQMRIPNKARGFSWRIPSNFAFPLLRPTLALVCHRKRKYLNATTRLVTLFQNFIVWIRTNRPLPHLTNDAGFFERLLRCRVVWWHPALGPTFWNNPAPRPARRHQHNFQLGLALRAIWQSGVLNLPARFGLSAVARTLLHQSRSGVLLLPVDD